MNDYEKVNSNMAASPNPPPYSAQEPQDATDPLKHPMGQAPPMAYGAAPQMPTQYQGYYMPPGAIPIQGPVLQQPQAVYVTPVQPVNEPDYLGYSIFTMLCCCLPLGIAALVYSIQTKEANQRGNLADAKRNSHLARTLANIALGLGLVFLIIYIVLVVLVATTTVLYVPPYNP